jgi:hypothetical protein
LKKEFLKAFELSDEVIDTIMAEAAKDVSKYADYDELKRKLESVKDYDDVKISVAEWEKKYADKESELSGVKFSHALTEEEAWNYQRRDRKNHVLEHSEK